jgi:hypothetical protein
MNNIALFGVGTFVSLLVAASVALLSWGAVLDGRDERERLRLVHDAAAEGTLAPRNADAASLRGGAA